jgi:hypothetical protein
MSRSLTRRALTALTAVAALTAALVLPAVAPATAATDTTTVTLSPSSGPSLTGEGLSSLATSLTCEPGQSGEGSPDFVRLVVTNEQYTARISAASEGSLGFGIAFGSTVRKAYTTGQLPVNADGTVTDVAGIFPVSTNGSAGWSTPLAGALTEGKYSLVAVCVNSLDNQAHTADTGDGNALGIRMAWTSVDVKADGSWSAETPAAVTSTALAATLNADNTATLAATVTAAGAAVGEGVLEFYEQRSPSDAPVKLGEQPVTAGGAASFTTPVLNTTDGYNGSATHFFRAVYVPATGAYVGSEIGGVSVTVKDLPAAATSTTVTATANADKTVALAATVTSDGKPVTGGTLQFKEGTTAIGDPATVGADGTATYTTGALTVGTHTFSGVFTPASGATLTGSTSADVTVTIADAPSQKGTSLALAAVPAVTTSGELSVGLGTVVFQDGSSAKDATGTVQFSRNGQELGTPVEVTGGTAALRDADVTFDTAYTYGAVFTPAEGSTLKTATSDEVTVQVKSATLLANGATIVPGNVYRVVAPDGTFDGNETVNGVIHSTPTPIGSGTATAAGGIAFTFQAPSGLEPGNHSIVLTGASGRTYTVSVSVATGTANPAASFATDWVNQVRDNPTLLALLGGALVLFAGAGVVGWNVFWRRRGGMPRS